MTGYSITNSDWYSQINFASPFNAVEQILRKCICSYVTCSLHTVLIHIPLKRQDPVRYLYHRYIDIYNYIVTVDCNN